MTAASAASYDRPVIPARGSRAARRALLVTCLLAAVAAAGCDAARPTTTGPSPTGETSPSPAPETSAPAESTSPSPSPSPTPTPSAPPPSPTPTPLPNGDPAAVCSGSDRNRDFYAAVAEAVDWDVYCPVLPSGWYVDRGTYRLAAGGRLEIAYTGPAGTRLELREGAFCTEPDGCVPVGTEVGEAPFGDRPGVLIELDDGGWAVVVDRGERISWLAVGRGLSREEFVDLVGRLALVDA